MSQRSSRWMRLKTLLAANINALVEQAENPEKSLRLLIRQMEEASRQLRKDISAATRQERQLKAQLEAGGSPQTTTHLETQLDDLDTDLRQLCQQQLRLEDRLSQARQMLAARRTSRVNAAKPESSGTHRSPLDRKIARSEARLERFHARLDQLESQVEAYDLAAGTTRREVQA